MPSAVSARAPGPAPHHHHSHPVPRLLRVVPVTGTVFTLDVRHPLPAGGVIEQVIRWWRRVDETFSPFRPGSQVSRLNAGTLRRRDRAGELAQVLALCQQASAATGGYFDAYASGTLDPSGLVKGWSVETASAMLAPPDHPTTASTAVAISSATASGRRVTRGGWGSLIRCGRCCWPVS